MAGTLTRSDWSESTIMRGGVPHKMFSCVTTIGSANDTLVAHVTKPTPLALDTTKNFVLVINSKAVTLDDNTSTTDIFGGCTASFAVADDGTTITAGASVAANINSSAEHDAAAGFYGWVAENMAPYPYLVMALVCGSAAANAACTWEIYQ